MVRLLKQFLSGEKGQALPVLLGLLAIGGLTIAVSLNYATTSLKGSGIVAESTKGIYAAGAGVEYALWSVGLNGTPLEEVPPQLSQNINQMPVGMETLDLGTFTLYCGELADPGDKSNYLALSSNISWVEGTRYMFQITVTWQPETGSPNLHLETMGARIPVGYHYEADSVTRSDGEAACDPELPQCPEITQDDQGADLLNWLWKDWGLTRPELNKDNQEFILTFYITGTGSLAGRYAWVLIDPAAYGLLGEITGTRYRITATATRPEDGSTTAEIVSDVMIQDDGTVNIVSWQISK